MIHIGENYQTIPKSLLQAVSGCAVRGEGTFPVLLGHSSTAIPVQLTAVWLLCLQGNQIYLAVNRPH